MKKVKAVVLGYGNRGATYAKYAVDHPELLEIVAVAEVIENRREYARKLHNIPPDRVFSSWEELAQLPKIADVAIIALQDRMHCEPAIAMIEKGYPLFLEKPMAENPEDCKRITEAAEKKGVHVMLGHVLRFTDFWVTLKNIIDSGEIGEITTITHLENVGILNYSHSFVRGNWRRSDLSSAMILQKCCHDTDIIQWLIGKPCKKVQSFGSLTHFKKENKPAGAPMRCTDGCPHAEHCYYNAIRLYYDDKDNTWLRGVAANTVDNPPDEVVMEALKTGPYGRCIYECDNNVVDHQTVNMEFEGGCTATLTMNAFNKGGRFIRVFGTKGEIFMGADNCFHVFTIADQKTKQVPITVIGNSITDGHGGGDTGIMVDLVKFWSEGVASKSISNIRDSYLSHLIAFAAEESRLSGKIIDLEAYSQAIL